MLPPPPHREVYNNRHTTAVMQAPFFSLASPGVLVPYY